MGKRKFQTEYKLEIIKKVMQSDMTVRQASDQYAVQESEIRKWINLYQNHGLEGLNRRNQKYTPEFKRMVVEDVRTNQISYRMASHKYNIGMHTSIQQWERIYLEEGVEGLHIERRGRACGGSKGRAPKLDKKIEEDLIGENQRLRTEIAYLKKLNALVLEEERPNKRRR